MKIQTWVHRCVLAVGLTVMVGCGDSPELRMQQAQIAMANRNPERALSIITSVLDETPGDLKAMLLKARAQMLLAHLADSRRTLDQLIEAQPDNLDVRLNLVDWTWFQIRSVLSQSEFSTDSQLQEQFDDAMSVGQAQVEWLIQNEENLADAYYYQARYAISDVDRLGMMVAAEEKSLRRMNLLDRRSDRPDSVVERLKVQMDARTAEAVDSLRQAIELDPRHDRACQMYAGLLVQRERWPDLWVLVGQISQTDGLSASTAQRLVTALLEMPDTQQPKAKRLKTCWKIQRAVNKAHKTLPLWKLASARLHLVAGQPAKAKPLLEAAIKRQPRNNEAQYLLAQSLYGLKKFDQAKAILEKLSTKLARSSRVQTLYGLVLMQTGDTVLAKEALRRATDLDPDDSMARESFLALMAQEGHIGQAQADIDEYIKRNPTDPRAIRFKMQYEQSQGRPQVVTELLARVETISPLSDEHLRVLIDGYMMLQKYPKAQRYARRLTDSRPDSLDSHLKLAEAVLMQGKDDQVKQMLVDLRKRFPQAANINQMLGRLYLQRQSFDRAVELLEVAVEQEPTSMRSRLLLAQGLASLSLVDEALDQIDQALEQDPQNIRAHAMGARINQFAGRSDKANEHLAQIDETRISETTSPALLAQMKIKKGLHDEAAAICNRAIASGHTDPVLRMIVAGIYLKKNDPAQAEIHLLGLIRSQPNNQQAYGLLSRFYLQQDTVDKGLDEFARLQSVNEPLARLAQAWLLVGAHREHEALERLDAIYEPLIRARSPMAFTIGSAIAKIYASGGDVRSARKVFDTLIEADLYTGQAKLRQIDLALSSQKQGGVLKRLDELAATLAPDQKKLQYQVMARYRGLGRSDRALELLEKWLVMQPEQPSLLRWKGELLVELGKPDEAIEVYQKAIAAAPETVALRLLLAQAHTAKFDFPGSEVVLRDVAKLDGGARIGALASLGRMYLALGLNRKAAEAFDELERFGRPKDPRVMYAMGQAYSALGMDDLARQRLEEVPPYAHHYAKAGFLLARIEQRKGLVDQAKKRLEALCRNPRTVAAATQELLALGFRSRQTQDLIKWSDQALSIEQLTPELKLAWLGVRVKIDADAGKWSQVSASLEKMSQLDPSSMRLAAARILVMVQRKQVQHARRLYSALPDLPSSQFGPSLAVFLGQPAPSASSDRSNLMRFFERLAVGDIQAARSDAQAMPPMRAFFRSDLLAILDRSDVQSPHMAQAARVLVGAMVAIQCGLPQLGRDLAQSVVNQLPTFTVGYAILVRALLDLNEPITPIYAAIKQVSNSSLAIYLRATELSENKKFVESAEALETLLERDPDNSHLRYQLTQMLQRAGRLNEAITLLETVIAEEGPYKIAAANDLAYLLAENHPNRLDEAYQLARQAIAAAPKNTALLDTLGWIEHARGHSDVALGHLSQAAVRLSALPEVHYHLGVVYKAVGNAQWARSHLEQAAAGPEDRPDVAKAKEILAKWGS